MLHFFYALTHKRFAWFCLFFSAMALLSFAFYLQHTLLFEPCTLCVYERLALVVIAIGSLLGLLHPNHVFTRPIAFLLWGIGSVHGLLLSLEHLQTKNVDSGLLTCSMSEPFPAWMPLDTWLPELFFPTGRCDDPLWFFAGFDLVQWLTLTFIIYLLGFTLFILSIGHRILYKRSSCINYLDRF